MIEGRRFSKDPFSILHHVELELFNLLERPLLLSASMSSVLTFVQYKRGDIDLMSNKSLLENADDDPLRSAISKFRSAYQILPEGPTILESIRVSNFVRDREYATIQELYDYVEQLFSEMLQHFLAQLPNCVFKQVNDGSVEDCEERARFIAKHLCQLHSSLEDKVQWKFPVGFPNTPHFFDSPQDHVTATSHN
ncbi:hypothetical protein Scep_010971 [Stephania cephalantha]|uniref:Uncharacterized protein n=1 Tax=Stephania cephalantha TaxID=152367 RepID=A0AAP0JX57_9MAGN